MKPTTYPTPTLALIEVRRRILGLAQEGEAYTFTLRVLPGGGVELHQRDATPNDLAEASS